MKGRHSKIEILLSTRTGQKEDYGEEGRDGRDDDQGQKNKAIICCLC